MRYTLEKYSGAKTRYTCPNCQQKQEFSRYVDNENGGIYLADDVGKCNRVSKCGYHKTPKEHFAENPAATNQRAASKPKSKSTVPLSQASLKEIGTIPAAIFEKAITNFEQNNFARFLINTFGSDLALAAIETFGVGTYQDGRAIFWQLDQRGRIRTGKIIKYGNNGKREKCKLSFVHSKLKATGVLPPDFNLKQCLFGEHQLIYEKQKPVAVVESEKTAVIATILMPDYVWMATGGKENLQPEKFTCLKDSEVILFPDADAFTSWSEKAQTLRKVCPKLKVSALLESTASDAEKADGYDLADYLLGELQEQELQADAAVWIEERVAIKHFDGGISLPLAQEQARVEFQETYRRKL